MNWKRALLVILAIFCLVLIRINENWLFYDPFILYFKNIIEANQFPSYEPLKLFFYAFFRFSLNSIVSFFILFVIFKKWTYIKLAIIICFFVFIVLYGIYFWILKTEFYNGYLIGFYIRRFLIHPIILIVLLPSFYFLEKRVD